MSAVIAGFGSGLPEAADQDELWEGHFRHHFGGSRAAGRVFAGAGVRRRHAVANPLVEDVSGWSTEARMRRYAEAAPALAHQAVSGALARAGVAPEEVGLLAVVTCTGYDTPGVDIALAESLPLAPDTRRLIVGHMGCYAALPGLDSATDYVVSRGRPAALVCVELTSLHVQPPELDLEQVVCHALFGDAAAAMVLRPSPAPGLRVVDTVWWTETAAKEHMSWRVTDLGFRMGLSPKVPELLGDRVGSVVAGLLHRNGLTADDVAAWAVHPGGPRILDTVENTLELPPGALKVSRDVLAGYGNCSSATIPLILGELAEAPLPPGAPLVAMAFGPGLTLSAALLSAT